MFGRREGLAAAASDGAPPPSSPEPEKRPQAINAVNAEGAAELAYTPGAKSQKSGTNVKCDTFLREIQAVIPHAPPHVGALILLARSSCWRTGPRPRSRLCPGVLPSLHTW